MCCNNVAVLLHLVTQHVLIGKIKNLVTCFSYNELSSGQKQNEVLVHSMNEHSMSAHSLNVPGLPSVVGLMIVLCS